MSRPQTVVAVLSRKGGVGKTTITMNLAIASGKATILDTDPQASAADWGDRRDGKPPEVITCPPSRIKTNLAKCTTEWVFIDTQPSNSDGPLEAAKQADICLIVTRPNQVDLDAIGSSLSIATIASKPCFVVLNQVQPQASGADVIALIQSAGAEVVPTLVRNRVDFANAPIAGLGVTEHSPNSKAAEEINQLFAWLEQQSWHQN